MRALWMLGGVFICAAIARASIIDQRQEQASEKVPYAILNNYYEDGNHVAMWQSFTARMDGRLGGIALRVDLSPADFFTLGVYAGQGVDGPLLASTSYSNIDASVDAWTNFDLSGAPLLATDSIYTFAIMDATGGALQPGPEKFDVYTAGVYNHQGYIGMTSGEFTTEQDAMFRTYMVPEPSILLTGVVGLSSLGMLRRRRRL